jgi:hypothetical protein
MKHNHELQQLANNTNEIVWEQVPPTDKERSGKRPLSNFYCQYSAVILQENRPQMQERICLRIFQTPARCHAVLWVRGIGDIAGTVVVQGIQTEHEAVRQVFSAAGFNFYTPGQTAPATDTILQSFIQKYFADNQWIIIRALA